VDGAPHGPGKLVAFDPVAQNIRWSVDHPLPFNGGVMATAGNLVFQGNAEGSFVAYAADTGEQLWSVTTGSSIGAAPSSYTVGGEQHVLIPIGGGGGLQFYYPEMHTTENSRGPTRLLAFSLDGDAGPPPIADTRRVLPEQPDLDATTDTIEFGEEIYAGDCKGCHGFAAVARAGGSVPDLRYSSAETHQTWNGIVIGGAKRANGMPPFELDVEEAEAVRAYVLSLSNELRQSQATGHN
jgi:quinohemoprotein ethanol dehydrogenase